MYNAQENASTLQEYRDCVGHEVVLFQTFVRKQICFQLAQIELRVWCWPIITSLRDYTRPDAPSEKHWFRSIVPEI